MLFIVIHVYFLFVLLLLYSVMSSVIFILQTSFGILAITVKRADRLQLFLCTYHMYVTTLLPEVLYKWYYCVLRGRIKEYSSSITTIMCQQRRLDTIEALLKIISKYFT